MFKHARLACIMQGAGGQRGGLAAASSPPRSIPFPPSGPLPSCPPPPAPRACGRLCHLEVRLGGVGPEVCPDARLQLP